MSRSYNSRKGTKHRSGCPGCPQCDHNRPERQAPLPFDIDDEMLLAGEMKCLRGECSLCGPGDDADRSQ